MDRPVELIPLVCVKCSTPVPAEVDEVAWVCAQCGQGLSLDEEKGLAVLEVNYAAGIPPDSAGRPFWVTDGKVALSRATYSGDQGTEAQRFWNQPRRFFIPAYSINLEGLLTLGVQLLAQPPDLTPGPTARFTAVTLSQEDLPAAAEFVVVAIEAGRKDKVKEIKFSLQLSPAVLWILP